MLFQRRSTWNNFFDGAMSRLVHVGLRRGFIPKTSPAQQRLSSAYASLLDRTQAN